MESRQGPRRCSRWRRWTSLELAGAGGGCETSGSRTEAVLLAALRAAAPAVRAVRSADRANMLMFGRLGAGTEEGQWGGGGGDSGGEE